jgi:very-short-patch-repair endonuclease
MGTVPRHKAARVDPLRVVRDLGGVARTRDLRAAAISPSRIAAACASGRIERVRIGHFADPELPEQVKAALRVGGRAACITVAEAHGGRSLLRHPVHVEVGLHDSRFRRSDDATRRHFPHEKPHAVLHWTQRSRPGVAVPLAAALVQVLGCLELEDAVCVLDSVLRSNPGVWGKLKEMAPGRAHSVLALVDRTAESPPESVFRVRARAAGLACMPQAPLPWGKRGDFLIGDRLVVEVDGAMFHAGREEFVADRERDALLIAAGYLILHFTYDQVVRRWDEVLTVIRSVMRRGEHLWAHRTLD